jgi:hypothetical protein
VVAAGGENNGGTIGVALQRWLKLVAGLGSQ